MRLRLLVPFLLTASALVAAAPQEPHDLPTLVPQGEPSGFPRMAAFGGNGRWLASLDDVGLQEPRLRVIDVQSGRTIHVFPGVASFAAHPTDDLLVISGDGGPVAVRPSGEELWRLELPSGWLTPPGNLQFNADGSVLLGVFGSFRRFIGLPTGIRMTWSRWSGRDGRAIPTSGKWLTRSLGVAIASSVQISADGRWLQETEVPDPKKQPNCRARGCYRSRLRDFENGRTIGPELPGLIAISHAGAMRVVVYSPAVDAMAMRAVSGSPVMPMALIDVATGKELASWVGSDAQFSADGATLLVNQSDGPWRLVDARNGQTRLKAPAAMPYAARWVLSPDGRTIAGLQNGRLLIADARDPVDVRVLGSGPAPLLSDQDVPTLEQLRALTSGSADPDEVLRNPTIRRTQEAVGPKGTPATAFAPDGRWFVARSADGNLDTWDTATGNRAPFRLAPTPELRGPLYVQTAQVETAYREMSFEKMVAREMESQGARRACTLATAAHEVTSDESEAQRAASERLYERWKATRPDGSVVGCALSPDLTRVLVLLDDDANARQARRSRTLRASVITLANGREAALRDGAGSKVKQFDRLLSAIGNATPQWTLDGQFLVATEAGFLGGRLHAWRAMSGEELPLRDEALTKALVAGLVADTPYVLTVPATMNGRETLDADLWDLSTLRRIAQVPKVAVDQASLIAGLRESRGVSVSTNGTVLVVPDTNETVRLQAMSSGAVLGQLQVMRNGDWLVTTPDGLFDGSPGGWQQIGWRTQDGMPVESGELFFNEFFRPGLLADLLQGRAPHVERSIAQRDRRQPTLTLTATSEGPRTARVRIQVAEAPATPSTSVGSGVRDVRLFHNGSLVKRWHGDVALTNGSSTLDILVPLTAGENRFTAFAFNRDDIKSLDASGVVTVDGPPHPAAVYVLAIGVNRYANPQFDLKYAVPDAQAFAAAVAARQHALDPAATVHVIELLDADATRDNILLALSRLAGTHTGALPPGAPTALERIARAQPEDSVFVYFAGHGAAVGERFHLIPADITYRGSREAAREFLPQLLARSVSDEDLERAFEPIDARHLALIIDACQSGQAIGPEDSRYGPMNSRGLAQLAYEKGMSILAASQAYQAALESAQLGHGYLTFALVQEALQSAVADRTPVDGAVTVGEWFDYAVARVPQLQLEGMAQARQEGRELRFDVAAPGTTGHLQTPRAFTKRDASGPPLVVFRPSAP